eukprot:1137565-Pelagomonas_calceolata.AAC.2
MTPIFLCVDLHSSHVSREAVRAYLSRCPERLLATSGRVQIGKCGLSGSMACDHKHIPSTWVCTTQTANAQVPPAYAMPSVEIGEEDSFASVPQYPLASMELGELLEAMYAIVNHVCC